MTATVVHGAGDVRIENVPDARLIEPTDALLRITRACICGSDLWPYKTMEHDDTGRRMGHEFIGVVEAIGAASGLVNVAHQLGGSLGLGILVTVFAAAGSAALGPRHLLAH